ncbi:MAG TPA: glucose 1-dehydrogenase [Blastocatellia bacterium]|nr:glucose 1-dehydrogenase [Blastocatellia bacterium]
MKDNPGELKGRVAGKVALITGAASGIGRAAAILLAREGAKVAVTDLDMAGAGQTVEAIEAGGGVAFSQRLDVTSEADWQTAIGRVERTWGRLDILVNSAGISFAKPITEMALEEWRRVMAVNLDAIFLGTRAAIRAMQRAGRGSIINISSASGIKASAGASAYCASKAAVIHFSSTAALECVNSGLNIRVNTVVPAGVKTPMWSKMPFWPEIEASEVWNAPPDAAPLKRFAEPEEIAGAILYLASDESSYVTGSKLVIDGGYTV